MTSISNKDQQREDWLFPRLSPGLFLMPAAGSDFSGTSHEMVLGLIWFAMLQFYLLSCCPLSSR